MPVVVAQDVAALRPVAADVVGTRVAGFIDGVVDFIEFDDVVIATRRGNYEKILSNIQEVKARKGKIISIVTEGDTDVKALSDWSYEIPDTEECFEPILSIIPLQLLAYHIAIAKGRDVDQPRNLAKSVTVE